MSSTTRRRLVGAFFGLIAGWSIGGAVFFALSMLLLPPKPEGAASWSNATIQILPFLALAVRGGIAVAVALLLVRVADARRQLGWGCLAVGGAIALNGTVILLFTGVLPSLLGLGTRDGNEAGAGFLVLMLSLPYALLCLVLLLSGALLLRAGARRTQTP